MKVHWIVAIAAISSTLVANAASPIDCEKASNPTEKTVCVTPSLLQADARMTAYIEIATQFVGMGVRGDLYDSQQAFRARRKKCGTDRVCILACVQEADGTAGGDHCECEDAWSVLRVRLIEASVEMRKAHGLTCRLE